MNAPFAFWGCGRDGVRCIHPSVRMLAGVLLLSAAMVVPLYRHMGLVIMVTTAAVWWMLSGMPRRISVKVGIASVVFFLPFLFFTPWSGSGVPEGLTITHKFLVTGTIVLRGSCCLLITASTVAMLPLTDIHRGFAGLPLPAAVSALLLQLVNQTSLLLEETWRVINVLKMRNATGTGGINVLFAFPVVWMGRVLFRAERVAAAMAVRGYDASLSATGRTVRLTRVDSVTLALTGAVVIASVTLRGGLW